MYFINSEMKKSHWGLLSCSPRVAKFDVTNPWKRLVPLTSSQMKHIIAALGACWDSSLQAFKVDTKQMIDDNAVVHRYDYWGGCWYN